MLNIIEVGCICDGAMGLNMKEDQKITVPLLNQILELTLQTVTLRPCMLTSSNPGHSA